VVEQRAQTLIIERSPPSYQCLQNDVDSYPVGHELMVVHEVVEESQDLPNTSAVSWDRMCYDTMQKRVA
jgi:hypothetical protein